MIGNSYEVLLLMSYQHDFSVKLSMTPQKVLSLRNVISMRKISEAEMCDILTRLDCKCIRPQVVMPAIVRDKNGRIFDEFKFFRLHFTPDIAKRFGLNYNLMLGVLDKGRMPSERALKHIIWKHRASIVYGRETLPSIWSYEPIPVLFTESKIADVRRMLGYSEDDEY